MAGKFFFASVASSVQTPLLGSGYAGLQEMME